MNYLYTQAQNIFYKLHNFAQHFVIRDVTVAFRALYPLATPRTSNLQWRSRVVLELREFVTMCVATAWSSSWTLVRLWHPSF
jgi:hypothetical protein